MRVGRVGRMPFAVDDADGDLALAFGKGVIARLEMDAERSRGLRQFGIVHPDLIRPQKPAAGFDQRAVGLLLLRRHLLVGDLRVTAKGWLIGHFKSPSHPELVAYPAAAARPCRARTATGQSSL